MKTCSICQEEKSVQEFHKHPTSADRLQYHCIECNRKRNRKRAAEYRARSQEIKVARGCSRCGYRRCARALHFHHVDPGQKQFSIGRATQCRTSWKKISEEIEKCIVLCANCHAELHG